MKIKIEYYSLLKDQRGCASETLETEVSSPQELYSELKSRYSFSLESISLKVAVNEDFADWDIPLRNGDTVVFIPPVAGG